MLQVVDHDVELITEGPSGYRGSTLALEVTELRRQVLADARIVDAQIELVRPGDAIRVANVLDVFDARARESGSSYPGIDGPTGAAAEGELHRFRGFQIIETGIPPTGAGGLMVARRAFIDFWGEGARWSPFSTAQTLVLSLDFDPDLVDKVAIDEAARSALVSCSRAIGRLGLGVTGIPRTYAATWERDAAADLPRVAYVYQIQSQGPLVDTFVYGKPAVGLFPTLIDPIEIVGGALVSGNHQRVTTPTFMHCNNPVIERLFAEDGRSLNFVGVVLMEGHHKTTPEKQRSADHAVHLLQLLRADGAIFTQEGGGMSIVDQMLTIQGARRKGIESVAITYEMAGSEGADRPLIYFSRSAKNLVSTGNRDWLIRLEAPAKVVGLGDDRPASSGDRSTASSRDGGPPRRGSSTEASERVDITGEVEVPLWVVYGAVSQTGGGKARAFSG